MLPSRHFASPSDSDKATNDALNNGSDLEDDNDDDNRGAGDDDDDDDDDGADDDDDDDDDDNLGLDSEFDRRAGVGKPMYSRTFTDMMPLATATGGGDEDVDVGSFGTEGLLSTSPPVPDFSSLMPKVVRPKNCKNREIGLTCCYSSLEPAPPSVLHGGQHSCDSGRVFVLCKGR